MFTNQGIDGKSLNVEYFKDRLKQYRTVFPDYEFIGWYAIGNKPNADDAELNVALRRATGNESPFFTLYNPSTKTFQTQTFFSLLTTKMLKSSFLIHC